MRVHDELWNELEESGHGTGATMIRLYPASPRDLFLAVNHPGHRRMLVLQSSGRIEQIPKPPRTRGVEIGLGALSSGRVAVMVMLTDPALSEVFNPLVTDIAREVEVAPSDESAVAVMLARFEHWRTLLESLSDEGLSPERRRGLFGELYVLEAHVLPSLPPVSAVAAWTGPSRANQDFQAEAVAIEVKTTAMKQPQSLVIANERELDDSGVQLLLLYHVSVDERRGGTGINLNAQVERIQERLAMDSAARAMFDDKLVEAGYLPSQRDLYNDPRFTIRTTSVWRVRAEFPRVIESDLRPGVGDVRYRIVITGLDEFLVKEELLATILSGERR